MLIQMIKPTLYVSRVGSGPNLQQAIRQRSLF